MLQQAGFVYPVILLFWKTSLRRISPMQETSYFYFARILRPEIASHPHSALADCEQFQWDKNIDFGSGTGGPEAVSMRIDVSINRRFAHLSK